VHRRKACGIAGVNRTSFNSATGMARPTYSARAQAMRPVGPSMATRTPLSLRLTARTAWRRVILQRAARPEETIECRPRGGLRIRHHDPATVAAGHPEPSRRIGFSRRPNSRQSARSA
jgi:hypothetical protein